MTLTLAEFIATGRAVADLGAEGLAEEGPGRVYLYHGGPFINGAAEAGFRLAIGNQQWAGPLHELEPHLYDFALSEGFLDQAGAPGMTKEQAYSVASQWGSFIQAGDPGACFYGFRFNDGRPVSELHRAQCLAYLDADLLPGADGADAAELQGLRAYLATCEVRS